jgi:hypothetical protein
MVDATNSAFEIIPNGHALFLTAACRKKIRKCGITFLEDFNEIPTDIFTTHSPDDKVMPLNTTYVSDETLHEWATSHSYASSSPSSASHARTRKRTRAAGAADGDEAAPRNPSPENWTSSFYDQEPMALPEPSPEIAGSSDSDASRILTVRIRASRERRKAATTSRKNVWRRGSGTFADVQDTECSLPDISEGDIIVARHVKEDQSQGQDEGSDAPLTVLRVLSTYWGVQTYVNFLTSRDQRMSAPCRRATRTRVATDNCFAVCEIVSDA